MNKISDFCAQMVDFAGPVTYYGYSTADDCSIRVKFRAWSD